MKDDDSGMGWVPPISKIGGGTGNGGLGWVPPGTGRHVPSGVCCGAWVFASWCPFWASGLFTSLCCGPSLWVPLTHLWVCWVFSHTSCWCFGFLAFAIDCDHLGFLGACGFSLCLDIWTLVIRVISMRDEVSSQDSLPHCLVLSVLVFSSLIKCLVLCDIILKSESLHRPSVWYEKPFKWYKKIQNCILCFIQKIFKKLDPWERLTGLLSWARTTRSTSICNIKYTQSTICLLYCRPVWVCTSCSGLVQHVDAAVLTSC